MKRKLSTKKLDAALQQVATSQGVSVESVRQEISLALQAGRANPDPAVQEVWRNIPCKGQTPTVEEVLQYVINRVQK